MLLIVKVRLTSPLLGELKADERKVRRFKRNGQNLHVNQARWQEDFCLAAQQLGVTIEPLVFQPPAFMLPASIHLYQRRYKQDGKPRQDDFESLRKGTILTFDCLLRDDLPGAPTLPQFSQILSVLGQHFGVSQFGSKFGYGRFELLDATPAKLV